MHKGQVVRHIHGTSGRAGESHFAAWGFWGRPLVERDESIRPTRVRRLREVIVSSNPVMRNRAKKLLPRLAMSYS